MIGRYRSYDWEVQKMASHTCSQILLMTGMMVYVYSYPQMTGDYCLSRRR